MAEPNQPSKTSTYDKTVVYSKGIDAVSSLLGGLLGGNSNNNNSKNAEYEARIARLEQEKQERERQERERRHQQQINDIKKENEQNIENLRNQQNALMEQMQKSHDNQLKLSQDTMNEMKEERESDRKLYQQQMDKQQKQQQQLQSDLNRMRSEREAQQKKFEEREEKIKQQLEKKLNLIKAQTKQTQKEYDEKMKKLQESNDRKLKDLDRIRQKERDQHKERLNKMAKENEDKLKTLKSEELRDKIVHIEQLIICQIEQYMEKKRMAQKIYMKYKEDLLKIEREKKRLQTFKQEIKDRNLLNLVLIGITGHGKSTFACRLAGDSSNECDLGIFEHNAKVTSVTQNIDKFVCKNKWKKNISIVDTPGILDSNGKDFEHANNLVQYLKGCGGVNAFLLVKTRMPPRFDASFKNVLINLEGLLGPEFWKHVIIVLTHTKGADAVPSAFNQYANQLRQRVYHELGIKNKANVQLPCIGVDSFENYKKPIKKLLDMIPSQRFECNNLISPLQELQIQNENIKNAFLNYKKELDMLKYNILLKKKEIEKANEILAQNVANYKPKIVDLSMIETNDVYLNDVDDEKISENNQQHQPLLVDEWQNTDNNDNDDEKSQFH